MYKLELELTEVIIGVFQEFNIDVDNIKKSCNGWLDVTIIGTEKDIKNYLRSDYYRDESVFIYAEEIK